MTMVNESAVSNFRARILGLAEKVKNQIVDANLIGKKIPGNYMVVQIWGEDSSKYIFLKNGVEIHQELSSLEDLQEFRKDLEKGLVEKIKSVSSAKSQRLLDTLTVDESSLFN